MDVAQALDVYASKAPVGHGSCQAQARRAMRILVPHLTDLEIRALGIAAVHARMGEGRGEFDDVIALVRARMESRK